MIAVYNTIDAMVMIMRMPIKREGLRNSTPEESDISRILTDNIWMSLTAEMRINANDPIRCRHYEVKVVGYHQNTALIAISNIFYQTVKFRLPGHIYRLNRFIQDKQIWFF